MLTNEQFLEIIRESFAKYLGVNTSRSTAKLKTLHGKIAQDIREIFGSEYIVKSQDCNGGKEDEIDGRYYPKKVDIAVSKNGKHVAGYAVKFVMRNYSQNSNNYFENMLGETANIRVNSIPYFQIFIVFEKVPYYKNRGEFKKYDKVSERNLKKYFILSKDDPKVFHHVPDKTLIVLVKLKEKEQDYHFFNSDDYADYYKSVINDVDLMEYSTKVKDTFDNGVILNNYSDFIKRTYYIVQGNLK